MCEDYLKIGDFGCAIHTQTLRNTIVGCIAYISPEQLNNESYDEKIDVWSVGVLTYELIVGKAPF
jgi:serine/threonine protein kinase